mgnify:CR=1 FL=1
MTAIDLYKTKPWACILSYYNNSTFIKMKSLKYLLIASIVLSTVACYAQAKNQKIEIVKIYGSCEKCENTIEKAGNMRNQSNVDWNKETKMATISYDSLKTSKEEILKRIALSGYDSDTYLAPDDIYSSLPSCCHYERAQKTTTQMGKSNIDMATKDDSIQSNKMTEMQEANPLSVVFDAYFSVKDALVKTDGNTASIKANDLLTAISAVKIEALNMDVHMVWMKVVQNLKEETGHIAKTKETIIQRVHLNMLSKNLYEVMKVSKQTTPTYYQFCPMANNGAGSNWLSREETIRNPYYGLQMLECGNTVEIIKE